MGGGGAHRSSREVTCQPDDLSENPRRRVQLTDTLDCLVLKKKLSHCLKKYRNFSFHLVSDSLGKSGGRQLGATSAGQLSARGCSVPALCTQAAVGLPPEAATSLSLPPAAPLIPGPWGIVIDPLNLEIAFQSQDLGFEGTSAAPSELLLDVIRLIWPMRTGERFPACSHWGHKSSWGWGDTGQSQDPSVLFTPAVPGA